jgi:outer membrane receptor protein involved in Fe transport
MERVELTRGPNSVLFGVGSPAGGFNVGTKKAEVRRAHQIASFRFGSWDESRSSLDINQPLIRDKVAIRINGVLEDRNDWRPFAYDQERRYQFNVRWQVARRTRVDVEHELGRREYANAPRGGVLDSITPWIAAGRRLDTQAGAPFPANAGIQVLSTANSLVFDATSGAIYNVRNQSVSAPAGGTPGMAAVAGEENPNIFDFGLVPREVFLGGPGYGTSNDYDRTMAVVSHELLDGLFLEAAFNRETTVNQARNTLGTDNRIQVDTNALLPSGAPNPRAGQFYTEQSIVLRDRTAQADDIRLSGSYDINVADKWSHGLGRWLGNHRLAALYLHRDADQQDNQQQEAIVDSPLNTTAPDNNMNRLRRRTYFDLAGPVGLIGLADYRASPVSGIINQSDGRPVSTMFGACRLQLRRQIRAARLSRWRPRLRARDRDAGCSRRDRAQDRARSQRAWRADPDGAAQDRPCGLGLGGSGEESILLSRCQDCRALC